MSYLRRSRGKPSLEWTPRRCACEPGLFRFEWPYAIGVGAFCPACLLVTLRTEEEIARFLDLYEASEDMKAAIVRSLQWQLRQRQLELEGLDPQVAAREMGTLPFD